MEIPLCILTYALSLTVKLGNPCLRSLINIQNDSDALDFSHLAISKNVIISHYITLTIKCERCTLYN